MKEETKMEDVKKTGERQINELDAKKLARMKVKIAEFELKTGLGIADIGPVSFRTEHFKKFLGTTSVGASVKPMEDGSQVDIMQLIVIDKAEMKFVKENDEPFIHEMLRKNKIVPLICEPRLRLMALK